jgi:hypothetical protein
MMSSLLPVIASANRLAAVTLLRFSTTILSDDEEKDGGME